MRFYNGQHRHYGGIDLHVKTMYVCILDAEYVFTWYWLADVCATKGLAFVPRARVGDGAPRSCSAPPLHIVYRITETTPPVVGLDAVIGTLHHPHAARMTQ